MRESVLILAKSSTVFWPRFKWSDLVTACYQALKDRMMSVLTVYQEMGKLLSNVFQNVQVTSVICGYLSNILCL